MRLLPLESERRTPRLHRDEAHRESHDYRPLLARGSECARMDEARDEHDDAFHHRAGNATW